MGCEVEETAATQFVTSVGLALADPEKIPNFSLPVGGNQTLTDVLAEDLGDRIRLNSVVRSVRQDGDGVVVDYHDGDRPVRLRAKRAIVTAPADIAERILPDLPQQHRNAFNDITYGRYVIVGFFTDEVGPQRWDDYFAVSTPQLSFQAMFNHAAAMRSGDDRKPGGALACFAGGAHADALFDLPDEEIVSRYHQDLLAVFPELEGKLGEGIVRRHRRVVPFWAPGRRNSLPTLRDPLGTIYLAGDYQLCMTNCGRSSSACCCSESGWGRHMQPCPPSLPEASLPPNSGAQSVSTRFCALWAVHSAAPCLAPCLALCSPRILLRICILRAQVSPLRCPSVQLSAWWSWRRWLSIMFRACGSRVEERQVTKPPRHRKEWRNTVRMGWASPRTYRRWLPVVSLNSSNFVSSPVKMSPLHCGPGQRLR